MATLAFENVKKGDGRAIRRAAETTYNTFKGYLAPHSVFKQYMQMAGDPTTKALGKMTPEEKETKLDQAIAFLKSVPGFEAHARRLEAMNLGYLRGVSNPFANKFTTIIKDILPIKDKLSFPDSADPRMTPRIRSKFIEFAETGERILSNFARRLNNAMDHGNIPVKDMGGKILPKITKLPAGLGRSEFDDITQMPQGDANPGCVVGTAKPLDISSNFFADYLTFRKGDKPISEGNIDKSLPRARDNVPGFAYDFGDRRREPALIFEMLEPAGPDSFLMNSIGPSSDPSYELLKITENFRKLSPEIKIKVLRRLDSLRLEEHATDWGWGNLIPLRITSPDIKLSDNVESEVPTIGGREINQETLTRFSDDIANVKRFGKETMKC